MIVYKGTNLSFRTNLLLNKPRFTTNLIRFTNFTLRLSESIILSPRRTTQSYQHSVLIAVHAEGTHCNFYRCKVTVCRISFVISDVIGFGQTETIASLIKWLFLSQKEHICKHIIKNTISNIDRGSIVSIQYRFHLWSWMPILSCNLAEPQLGWKQIRVCYLHKGWR